MTSWGARWNLDLVLPFVRACVREVHEQKREFLAFPFKQQFREKNRTSSLQTQGEKETLKRDRKLSFSGNFCILGWPLWVLCRVLGQLGIRRPPHCLESMHALKPLLESNFPWTDLSWSCENRIRRDQLVMRKGLSWLGSWRQDHYKAILVNPYKRFSVN